MKVSKAEGYLSDDGTIYKTESAAIADNLYSIVNSMSEEASIDVNSNIDFLIWVRENKMKVLYILHNVDNVDNLDYSKE
jgi:hypothetical protein